MNINISLLAANTVKKKQPLCLAYRDKKNAIIQKGTVFGSRHYTEDLNNQEREVIYLIHKFMRDVMNYKFQSFNPCKKNLKRLDWQRFYIAPGKEVKESWFQDYRITKSCFDFTFKRFRELEKRILAELDAKENVEIDYQDKGEINPKNGFKYLENAFQIVFYDEQGDPLYELKILHP